MIRYLLDTNVVSEPLRPRPNPAVQQRLAQHGDEVAIASTVWHELLYVMERLPPGRRRSFLRDYLQEVVRAAVPILPFDTPAAEWLARERARLEAAGQMRPLVDGQIAAVAATRGLILVTRNEADFDGYTGLHVENWFEPSPA